MISVVYVVSSLAKVGPTNQLFNIITCLDKQKFSPIVLTLFNEGGSTKKHEFLAANINVQSLGLSKNVVNLVLAPFFLGLRLKKLNPDIIHSQGFLGDLFVFLSWRKPRVTTLRNIPQEDYPDLFGRFAPIISKVHCLLLKRTNVASCSVSIQRVMRRGGIFTEAIANGVDLQKYFPVRHREKLELRKDLGLIEDQFYIVIVGSLIQRKNISFALNALRRSDSSFKVIVLGKGPLINDLKNISGHNVSFLGDIENVFKYYQCADLFLSSSLSEGLPNAVIEAMACGLPCMLSDIPQHQECFAGDESLISNFLFSISDDTDLVRKLDFFISSGGTRSSRFSDIAEKYFSSKSMSNSYQNFYSRVLNNES